MAVFTDNQRTAVYVHLRTFESDFDKSQTQMRAISSAWSAAVLAAIALVTTTAATPVAVGSGGWLFPTGIIEIRTEALTYLRAVVCAVGSSGVLAFWYIDQGVYQRLLHSVFAYGLFVESKDDDLPQIRSSMFLANLDVTNRLGAFYRAQFWLFAILSIFTNLLNFFVAHNPAPGGVWAVSIAHFFAVLYWEVRSYQAWPSLDATIRDFYPELANALPARTTKPGWYERLMMWLGTHLRVNRPDNKGSKFHATSDLRMRELLRRVRHEPRSDTNLQGELPLV
jgi:hypothetical protein